MNAIGRILHISDLHFVEDIETHGRRLGWKHRTLGAKSHDFEKLDAFGWTLSQLRSAGRDYDILVASGDLTTDGSEQAFKTAREFIEERWIYRGQPRRIIANGLGAGAGRRLLIPGNHDRFGGGTLPRQRRSDHFERVLGTPAEYPYAVAAPLNGKSTTLLFFVYDTTPPWTVRFGRLAGIARGHVTRAECRRLPELANLVLERGWADGLDGQQVRVDRHNCIRIALLHHHPIVDEKKALTFGYRLEYMENHQVFVEQCFEAGIQLVLFGHQHLAYTRRVEPPEAVTTRTNFSPFGLLQDIYFLCCPSLLEYSSLNGFYLLELFNSSIRVQKFEWDGTGFAAQPPLPPIPL